MKRKLLKLSILPLIALSTVSLASCDISSISGLIGGNGTTQNADNTKTITLTLVNKSTDGTIETKTTQEAKYGAAWSQSSPKVENYSFEGWYFDADFTIAVASDWTPISNATIYAKLVKETNATKVEKLQEELAELTKNITDLTTKIDELTTDSEVKKVEIETLTQEKENNTATIESLTSEVEKLEAQIVENEKTIKEKQDEIDSLKNSQSEENVQKLNKQISELSASNDEMNNTISQLNSKITSLNGTIADLNERIESLENSNDCLTDDLADAEYKLEDARNDISNLEDEISSLEDELSEANSSISSLKSQVSSLQSQLSSYQTKYSDSQKLLTAYQNQISSLRGSVSDMLGDADLVIKIASNERHSDYDKYSTFGSVINNYGASNCYSTTASGGIKLALKNFGYTTGTSTENTCFFAIRNANILASKFTIYSNFTSSNNGTVTYSFSDGTSVTFNLNDPRLYNKSDYCNKTIEEVFISITATTLGNCVYIGRISE